jgi:hypothetical protein
MASDMLNTVREEATIESPSTAMTDEKYQAARNQDVTSSKDRRAAVGVHLEDTCTDYMASVVDPCAGAVGLEKSSSDYGDDDFDEDTLLQLGTDLPRPQGVGKDEITPQVQLEDCVDNSGLGNPSAQDEFDGLDDDIFDNADKLMVDADQGVSGRRHQGRANNQAQVQLAVIEQDEDDMYDDAFGPDFDFDAAELAATQSAGGQASTSCHVRSIPIQVSQHALSTTSRQARSRKQSKDTW